MPDADLLLQVTPPRVPRHLVARTLRQPGREAPPLVLVQSPPGFGKTSLLAQWRRDHLAQGGAVAWLSCQPRDDPWRLLQGLALAVRNGAGRPTFGHVLLEGAPPPGFEGVTTWLAEVAQGALDLLLLVDEADRLPAESRAQLGYLLRNAPTNLRCVVGARADCDLELGDLVAYGQATVVGAEQLRFRLEETLGLVRSRFGDRVPRDEAARLHEMAEGWPLGLQLALSVMDGAGGQAPLPPLDLHGGALREQFVGFLLRSLDAADHELLTRVSLVDDLHPELAVLLAGEPDAASRLARLVRETPVFVAREQGDWLRMHSVARAALRRRFDALPAAEQAQLHARAADWFASHDLLDVAAVHALAAGEDQKAYGLAERSLYESGMRRGRMGTVLDWLARMPPEELDRRPRLLLAAAWALATSERHDEAGRLVERILAHAGDDAALRCECALILGGASTWADDPDASARLHEPWTDAPPLKDPLLLQVHANRQAYRTLLAGDPALARLRQQQAPRAAGYLDRWGEFIVSLTYLWEGQVVLADQLLRPALAAAEGDLGRRSMFATLFASLLCAAAWEQDRPDEAAALLANRLDVLERSGLADCVLLGFRTMARMHVAAGTEHRALELLAALDAVGVARKLPRLRIASLAERARIDAGRYRAESCRAAVRELDALAQEAGERLGPLWRRSVQPLQAQSQAYAAIAAKQWRAALEPLERADAAAQQIRQGRLHIELLGLRAFVLDRCAEREGATLLREAADLAAARGLRRVLQDAHPDLGAWAREQAAAAAPVREAAPPAPAARKPTVVAIPSMALTPKEREVLELLARNLSNKEVALALQVGEETIKWHVKNLFAKLDAGTRKQVVQRARILGLLAEA